MKTHLAKSFILLSGVIVGIAGLRLTTRSRQQWGYSLLN